MKKIILPKEQIDEIIKSYKTDNIGLAEIGKKYNVSKHTIKKVLIENGVEIFSSGQRFKGGKSLADKRYYERHKEKVTENRKKWVKNNQEHLNEYRKKWREENKLYLRDSKNNRIVAHQYKIRKQKEIEERDSLPFNPNDVSLKNTKIEIIDRETCKKVIDEYEWLGYMPRYTNLHFGIYFEVNGNYHLGGVVAYQPEYGENLGIWDKYGFTNKIIQLSRGVCLWWTPKNTASFFIQRTLEYLKKNSVYKVVTATVDSSAGEIGVIYQSLNWYYVGLFGGNLTKSGKERIRYGYKIGNKIYNQRHIRERIGSASKENVMKHFPDVQIVNLGRKKRYFTFIGTKKENNELIKSIENLIKPYPKK